MDFLEIIVNIIVSIITSGVTATIVCNKLTIKTSTKGNNSPAINGDGNRVLR